MGKNIVFHKIGERVKFGPYQDFSESKVHTIMEVRPCEMFCGGVQYLLEDNEGHTVVAFSDEVELVD